MTRDQEPAAGADDSVDGVLDWVTACTGDLDLPPRRRQAVADGVDGVRRRLTDPVLRVAVVGETSSGKSTLLNAFLRARVLPSRATTATRALLRIRSGARTPVLSFRSDAGTPLGWPSGSFTTWCRQQGLTPPGDITEALSSLILGEGAEELQDLTLSWPGPLLAEDVELIDTPGFSIDAPGHRELALHGIRQADLVLAVMPAMAATSGELLEFLTGPARSHLDRCLFLVTKADLVDEVEHSDVLEVAHHRLRAAGVREPRLLLCAPGPALREHTTGGGAALLRFVEVERRIAELAHDGRRRWIRGTVDALLRDLLDAVEQDARALEERLRTAEERLGELDIPDLEPFLGHWAETTLRAVDHELSVALAGWSAAGCRAAVDAEIAGSVAGDRIKPVRQAVVRVANATRAGVHAQVAAVGAATAAAASRVCVHGVASLAESFTGQFRTLSALAGLQSREVPLPQLATSPVTPPDLSALDAQLGRIGDDLTGESLVRAGGGGVAGALIGNLFLPGLGAVIGGLAGAALASPGADTLRSTLLHRAAPALDGAVAEADRAVRELRQEVRASSWDVLVSVVREYRDHWGPQILELTRQAALRRGELARGIDRARAVAEGCRQRRPREHPGAPDPHDPTGTGQGDRR